jgi:hypothetical protein
MKKTKTLTVSSLMAALCLVILSLGSLVESLDISLSILAGLVIMILSAEYADRVAFAVFGVTGILSLLLPVKSAGILFVAIFGWYPIVQKKIHYLKPFWARIVKFLICNTVLALLLAMSALIMGKVDAIVVYLTLIVLANICFYMYDILLDRFLIWYIMKLRKHLRF